MQNVFIIDDIMSRMDDSQTRCLKPVVTFDEEI